MSHEKVRSIAHLLGWTWNPRWSGALRTISSSRPRIVRDHSTRRPAKPWSAQILCTPGWSRRVLPASKPRVPAGTVSAVRTDCESISPALGSAARPLASRTRPRNVSWTRSTVPSSCHQVKYRYTGGRAGSPSATGAKRTRSAPHRRSRPRSAGVGAFPSVRSDGYPPPESLTQGSTTPPAPGHDRSQTRSEGRARELWHDGCPAPSDGAEATVHGPRDFSVPIRPGTQKSPAP